MSQKSKSVELSENEVVYHGSDIEITNDNITIGNNVLINKERFAFMKYYIERLEKKASFQSRQLSALDHKIGDLKYLDKMVRYGDGSFEENEDFGVWVETEEYFANRKNPLEVK